MSGRHAVGRPVAELLDEADLGGWDTSLLSVHARRHRPYVAVPTPRLSTRWTVSGHLYPEGNTTVSEKPETPAPTGPIPADTWEADRINRMEKWLTTEPPR